MDDPLGSAYRLPDVDDLPEVTGSLTPCSPPALTTSTPSCTITVAFRPESPGPSKGVVFTNYLGPGAQAFVRGVGLLSRLALNCRKKNGKFISPNKITKYCVNYTQGKPNGR